MPSYSENGKRCAESFQSGQCSGPQDRPIKKHRVHSDSHSAVKPDSDVFGRASDELLIRILSFVPLLDLVHHVSRVCRRLHRLSSDSQIWRQLYYTRFVLPRALRIPGFQPRASQASGICTRTVMRHGGVDLQKSQARGEPVHWKRQYKLRHNWSQGKCAVEELDVGTWRRGRHPSSRETLAKVADGMAVTADADFGLRAWDLKTKRLLAEADLTPRRPTCLAVDDQRLLSGELGIAVGFQDGAFSLWVFGLGGGVLHRWYSHSPPFPATEKLTELAFSSPYLMTASEDVVVSLYHIESSPISPILGRTTGIAKEVEQEQSGEREESGRVPGEDEAGSRVATERKVMGQPPKPTLKLITSLKSHSSQEPLALAIRKMGSSSVASIAFTVATRDGWTLGIQDLHIRNSMHDSKPVAEVFNSRLAHAAPLETMTPRRLPSNPANRRQDLSWSPLDQNREHPTAICYSHPYLLATLPDNTLVLYLCTSNADTLSISRGIRLWGHTSGIADAEITSRGKAVSVSLRGDEVRVWELEGRLGGKSVEIRPSTASTATANDEEKSECRLGEWDDKRNWVGFDDEMVIVLKESKAGKESLVVYDFT